MEAIFQQYPYETARFFRRIIEFGFVCGAVFGVPSAYVLSETWQSDSTCDSNLRVWMLLRLFVFFVQIPFRVNMYINLVNAIKTPDRRVAINHLLQLCRSFSWKLNQYIGILVYCWFLCAFWLIYHYRTSCSNHPLYYAFIGNVLVFIVHMVVSWYLLRQIIQLDPFEKLSSQPGATTAEIAEHTSKISYVPGTNNCSASCPICISDYEDNCEIRILKCKHDYHPVCIDPWLMKKKSCPLCARDIDEKPKTE